MGYFRRERKNPKTAAGAKMRTQTRELTRHRTRRASNQVHVGAREGGSHPREE